MKSFKTRIFIFLQKTFVNVYYIYVKDDVAY